MSDIAQPISRRQPLTKEDKKTLSLSALGGTLEFYDFVIYALYIETVVKPLFLPADLAAGFWGDIFAWGGFAAGYLARPIGGVVMAHFGDTLGRKKMFTLSIFMMAIPTLCIGIMPTYETIGIFAPILLILFRVLQGAAIGGEMPGAWVFIAEHAPKKHYGLGIGILTGGIAGGILLGFSISLGIDIIYADNKAAITDYAWRIPFIIGGILGLVAVYLRRFLSETPVFQEMAKKRALSKEIPIVAVVKKHRLACLLTGLLTWSLSTTVMLGILFTPVKVLQGIYGMDPLITRASGLVAAVFIVIGCVVCGMMEDRIKTRQASLFFWGGLIISSAVFYTTLMYNPSVPLMMTLYAVMGFFAGCTSLPPIIATRMFPPAIRFSGLSFSYNIAYAIFSALTPAIAIALLKITPMGVAYYLWFIAALAIVIAFIPLAYKGWQAEDEAAPLAAAPAL
ncbi:MFS transporter [Wohlfahrtiimonas sp. G9077]|uniref:MFS transporter n=1 Tax=Wohlfahrtiimonas sp. G9077 TaxID=1980118 RepID=UPI000B99D553|nr:MFS transporter [Wohlfahrtiimonas sp. G9077]OYQ73428.1 MFS transporter [Wohlfahrtiimonas sp. G9077]